MENNNHTFSPKSFGDDDGKDKKFQVQKKVVFVKLFKETKTMLEVSVETGILRANICRYIAEWKRLGCVKLVKFGICPISKHRAGFYTTNPELFPSIVDPSNTVKL